MSLRSSRLAGGSVVALSAIFALACVLDSPGFALSAVPALLLAVSLLVGRFPGEELLAEIRERRRAAPQRRARREPAAARHINTFVRPVGRAAAFALAMRPPPAVIRKPNAVGSEFWGPIGPQMLGPANEKAPRLQGFQSRGDRI